MSDPQPHVSFQSTDKDHHGESKSSGSSLLTGDDIQPATPTTMASNEAVIPSSAKARVSCTSPDTYRPSTISSSSNNQKNEVIDQSRSLDIEKVVEVSPDPGRYLRLNTLLGKGAYKVVYKAIDREEGYEVAWNSIQASCIIYCQRHNLTRLYVVVCQQCKGHCTRNPNLEISPTSKYYCFPRGLAYRQRVGHHH